MDVRQNVSIHARQHVFQLYLCVVMCLFSRPGKNMQVPPNDMGTDLLKDMAECHCKQIRSSHFDTQSI